MRVEINPTGKTSLTPDQCSLRTAHSDQILKMLEESTERWNLPFVDRQLPDTVSEELGRLGALSHQLASGQYDGHHESKQAFVSFANLHNTTQQALNEHRIGHILLCIQEPTAKNAADRANTVHGVTHIESEVVTPVRSWFASLPPSERREAIEALPPAMRQYFEKWDRQAPHIKDVLTEKNILELRREGELCRQRSKDYSATTHISKEDNVALELDPEKRTSIAGLVGCVYNRRVPYEGRAKDIVDKYLEPLVGEFNRYLRCERRIAELRDLSPEDSVMFDRDLSPADRRLIDTISARFMGKMDDLWETRMKLDPTKMPRFQDCRGVIGGVQKIPKEDVGNNLVKVLDTLELVHPQMAYACRSLIDSGNLYINPNKGDTVTYFPSNRQGAFIQISGGSVPVHDALKILEELTMGGYAYLAKDNPQLTYRGDVITNKAVVQVAQGRHLSRIYDGLQEASYRAEHIFRSVMPVAYYSMITEFLNHGQDLTLADLNAIVIDNLQKGVGSHIEVGPEAAMFLWMFDQRFKGATILEYTLAKPYGLLLEDLSRENGEFKERFLEMLQAGGTKPQRELFDTLQERCGRRPLSDQALVDLIVEEYERSLRTLQRAIF